MAMSLPAAHTAANCRWTLPERQTIAAPGWPQEHSRVCAREPGLHRLVTDQDCAVCVFWEPKNGAQAGGTWVSRRAPGAA